MNQTPNGVLRASGPRMSRKNATRWVGSSSVAVTSSFRRRTLMVARPAARRLRTHWTSPQGAQTHRRPAPSMMANGVVRGRPLFRPRMVTRALGPSGTPAATRTFAIGPKNVTHAGAAAALAMRSLMCVAPSCVDRFVIHMTDELRSVWQSRPVAAERQEKEMGVLMVRQEVKDRSVAAAEAAVRDRFATLACMRPVGQATTASAPALLPASRATRRPLLHVLHPGDRA